MEFPMQRRFTRLLAIILITVFVFTGSPVTGQAKGIEPPPAPSHPAATPSTAHQQGTVLQAFLPQPDQRSAANSAADEPGSLSLQSSVSAALGKPGTSYRLLGQFGQNPQPAPRPYPGDNIHLNHPIGMYLDSQDQIWVSENLGFRVLKANSDFPPIGTAGANYTDDYVLSSALDMARDKNGHLWIADDTRVVEYDVSGAAPIFMQNFPADQPWVVGSDTGRFNDAAGIAFDQMADQHMFVSDYNNHRVQIFHFDSNGTPIYINTIGDANVAGNTNTTFKNPFYATVDASNRLFFVDAGNNRVMRCTSSDGWATFTCASMNVGSPTLYYPVGIAASSAGDVYISDPGYRRILKCIGGNDSCSTVVSYLSQNYFIYDIAVDSTGVIYGADWENDIIRRYASSGAAMPNYMGVSGVPYVTEPGYLNRPGGVTIASDGSLYVNESRGLRLVKMDSAGNQLWTVGTPGVYGTSNTTFGNAGYYISGSPAVDSLGNVYISDTANQRIQVYKANGSYYTTLGSPNAQFSCPGGLAINPVNGDLLVTDDCNQNVQVFDPYHVYKATLGVTGEQGTDNLHFNSPENVAVDAAGAVYVADAGNHRVQKCTYTTGTNYACQIFFGETGVANGDFAHGHPVAVAVDAAGRVFVGDQWNNRVLVLDAAGKFLTSMGDGWGMNPVSLSTISGLAVDASGNLYVADYADSRVVKFALGVSGWKQVNLNGFGTPYDWSITALATFGGKLYAGTSNYSDPRGAQIWRQTTNGDWEQVATNGFGNAHNYAIDHLLSFNGYLYASTWTDGTGGEIWRSPSGDSLSWTKVVSGGSGTGSPDTANVEFFHMFIDSGQICAATWADTSVHGSEIWCSTNGTSWTRRVSNGFGDQNNQAILDVQRFGNYLYAGTINNVNGGKVYRTQDWSSWQEVATSGANSGRFPLASSLAVFNGYLYAGWGAGSSGSMTLTRCQVCDSSDWQVVPQASTGFGNANNSYNPAMTVAGNSLFVLVSNEVDGVQVWRSTDGLNWKSVVLSGFGLPSSAYFYWDHALLADNGALYAGIYSNYQGGQIWKMDLPSVFLPLVVR